MLAQGARAERRRSAGRRRRRSRSRSAARSSGCPRDHAPTVEPRRRRPRPGRRESLLAPTAGLAAVEPLAPADRPPARGRRGQVRAAHLRVLSQAAPAPPRRVRDREARRRDAVSSRPCSRRRSRRSRGSISPSSIAALDSRARRDPEPARAAQGRTRHDERDVRAPVRRRSRRRCPPRPCSPRCRRSGIATTTGAASRSRSSPASADVVLQRLSGLDRRLRAGRRRARAHRRAHRRHRRRRRPHGLRVPRRRAVRVPPELDLSRGAARAVVSRRRPRARPRGARAAAWPRPGSAPS